MRRHAKASFAGSTQGSGRRRGFYGLVCLCVLGLAAFLGSSAPSAGAAACPNEAFRGGPSGNLPDCRAYEMVSPPEKAGLQIDDTTSNTVAPTPVASRDGNAVVWATLLATFGEVESGVATGLYFSQRGANWNSKGVSPPFASYNTLVGATYWGFTEDADKMFFTSGWDPPLTPDASEGTTNSYLRDLSSGSYRLLSVGAPADLALEFFGELFFTPLGISEGASHVVIESPEEIELTEDSATAVSPYLYDWSAATGALTLVGRRPDNSVSPKKVTIAAVNYRRPVSADGSRIFFHEAGGGECGICVRINGATTQLVSEGGTFQVASSDGSLAFVTDGGDLERYDVASDELADLTPGGEVQGVLGASTDGSRVYFVAKAELAPGATAGQNNLYLWSDDGTPGGTIDFIATGNTSSAFTRNWKPQGLGKPLSSRLTPDGMHLAFTANNSLTGYPDEGNIEAYLYSAATGELVCASCNPSGEPATSGGAVAGGNGQNGEELSVERLSRNLSDDGSRLFFVTEEALVPRDTDNRQDVYEYDAASGAVALISPGTEDEYTVFDDASASGDDAFFATRERLVASDQDAARDVYDARVDGGLASQYPSSPPPCTGDACRGESSSPNLAGAATTGFVGRGNVSQKQNCNKLGREAKKLSNRAKRLRKNAKQAQRNGKSALAKKRNKKANRLAKQARNKGKSAKKCRKANRRASK